MDMTYPEVGATRGEPLPTGYRQVRRRVLLGSGAAVFRAAADGLAHWQMQRGAGLAVRASAPVAAMGVRIASGAGAGPLRLWAPCVVVWVVDEARRYGYGYGTLPAHPEIGEEAFEVSLDEAGQVWFELRAFSRPGRWYMRLAGPLGHLVQDRITDRYVRSMRKLAAGAGDR
jgi:uncharacterized protein (UPF0548 family)